MATRLFFNGEYIAPNQVWIFRPHYGYAKIYIVKEIVNEKAIHCYGMIAPLELNDFYRLQRVRYVSLLPAILRHEVKHQMKKWGLRHLIYDPFNVFVSICIAFIITLIFIYLSIH